MNSSDDNQQILENRKRNVFKFLEYLLKQNYDRYFVYQRTAFAENSKWKVFEMVDLHFYCSHFNESKHSTYMYMTFSRQNIK